MNMHVGVPNIYGTHCCMPQSARHRGLLMSSASASTAKSASIERVLCCRERRFSHFSIIDVCRGYCPAPECMVLHRMLVMSFNTCKINNQCDNHCDTQ